MRGTRDIKRDNARAMLYDETCTPFTDKNSTFSFFIQVRI